MTVSVTPIDGWGFVEKVDGRLAPSFTAELLESGIEFSKGIRGWHAKALDGKYAGLHLEMTPRHSPHSGVVVLRVFDQENEQSRLFDGLAETDGLRKDWE